MLVKLLLDENLSRRMLSILLARFPGQQPVRSERRHTQRHSRERKRHSRESGNPVLDARVRGHDCFPVHRVDSITQLKYGACPADTGSAMTSGTSYG